MSELKNHRHELFCQALIAGKNSTQAAIAAGYSNSSSRCMGVKLNKNAKIITRLNELNNKAISENIMSVVQRKERLSEIAQARMSDFLIMNGGKPEIKLNENGCHNGAIQSATTRTAFKKKGSNHITTIELKLHDPLRAIAELNRMEGIGSWNNTVNIQQNFVPIKEIEIRLNVPDEALPLDQDE